MLTWVLGCFVLLLKSSAYLLLSINQGLKLVCFFSDGVIHMLWDLMVWRGQQWLQILGQLILLGWFLFAQGFAFLLISWFVLIEFMHLYIFIKFITQFCQLLERICCYRLFIILIITLILINQFVLGRLFLDLADRLLIILQQLINFLDLLTHFLDFSVFSILLFFVVLIRIVILLWLLIFGIWRLLAFLKVLVGLTLVFWLLITTFFLILVLFWLWRIMPEGGLITCNKLAPKPIKEIIDVEEGGASFG